MTACLAHRPTHNATEGDDVPSDKQHAISTGFTLLQDAKVYVIAHYLELTDLKNLALAAVQNVIDSTSEMRPKLLSSIVELVKYIYNHTDTLVSTKEPPRELVATFAAEWFHVFDRDVVKELMSKGGDSLIDIIKGPAACERLEGRAYGGAKGSAEADGEVSEETDQEGWQDRCRRQ